MREQYICYITQIAKSERS